MKKLILSNTISIISLFLLSILFSLTLSLLNYYKGFVLNEIIIQCISIVLFMISGLIFGLINKKQGLLGSIVFILVYLLFVLIFDVIKQNHNIPSYYFIFIIGKCISYTLGCILGVNIKTK